MDKLIIKKDVFNALTSETRLTILKSLDHRQKTVTELSKELRHTKSGIHRHLQKLIDVNLIKREESERKWIYYSLTFKGKNLLHPEKIQLTLVLSSILSFIIGIVIVLYPHTQKGTGIATHEKQIPYIAIVFLVVSLVFLITFIITRKKLTLPLRNR